MNLHVSALLILSGLVMPGSSSAQWGGRFTIAAGPAIGIDGTPPDVGLHLRASGALDPGPRTLNLLADAYVTRLLPGSETLTDPSGSIEFRSQETQIGVGLSGLLTLRRDHPVSPYVLLGGVYRRSDHGERVIVRDPSGAVDERSRDFSHNQLDVLFGAGTAFRSGTRRILIEARLYGGTALYLPVTLGLTF
jgi:hypothetical protein